MHNKLIILLLLCVSTSSIYGMDNSAQSGRTSHIETWTPIIKRRDLEAARKAVDLAFISDVLHKGHNDYAYILALAQARAKADKIKFEAVTQVAAQRDVTITFEEFFKTTQQGERDCLNSFAIAYLLKNK